MGKKLTLKVEGEELTKKDIKERFDKYNKMYFGGKLGKCEILWGLVNNADYGAYHAFEKEVGKCYRCKADSDDLRMLMLQSVKDVLW